MKTLFLSLAVVPLLVTSCCTTEGTKAVVTPVKPSIMALHDQLASAQTSLQGVQAPLDAAGQHLDNAKVAVLTTNNPTAVVAELDTAKSKLDEGKSLLTQVNASVMTAMNTVTQTVAAVEQSDKAMKTLQTDNNNLRDKLNAQSAWVYKLLLVIAAGLIVAGIGLCVASMAIGFASVRIGASVSAAGIALLVLTLTLQKYEKYLVIGCGVLLLVVGAYFCWQLFASAKANKELVEFGEAVKNKAGSDLKTQLFGNNADPHPNSVADSIQSETTQKIVSQLRQHLQIAKVKKTGPGTH